MIEMKTVPRELVAGAAGALVFFGTFVLADLVIGLSAACAVGSYFGIRLLVPRKREDNEMIIDAAATGNGDKNRLIGTGKDFCQFLNSSIEEFSRIEPHEHGKQFSRRKQTVGLLTEIHRTVSAIFRHVKDNPQDLAKIQGFVDYYLVRLEGFLKSYLKICREEYLTAEVINNLRLFETENLPKIRDAFEQFLTQLKMGSVSALLADGKAFEAVINFELLKTDFKLDREEP